MLHVGLLILKILGIILLIVLGLLLLFLYAVLFVAVSYRVRARREEKFEVTASAAWLFRIFSIYFSFAEGAEESLVLQVRLFGAPVWRIWGAKKPEKRKRKSGLRKRFRKRKPRKEKQKEVKEAVPQPERKAEEPQREEPEKEAVPKVPEEPKTSVRSEGSPVSEKKVRKRSFFHRLFRGFWTGRRSFSSFGIWRSTGAPEAHSGKKCSISGRSQGQERSKGRFGLGLPTPLIPVFAWEPSVCCARGIQNGWNFCRILNRRF